MRRVRIMTDRFGMAWRPELALDLHRSAGRVEVLEFLAEEWFGASRQRLASLAAWCREIPCHLHGTSLGLASATPIAPERLCCWKELIDTVQPARWSEHLAFVRGGGVELGHLAAPSRNVDSLAGAVANLRRIRDAVGSMPLVENVATLMAPPGSDWAEPVWLSAVVGASGAGLLLDLHNLHTNAVNQGWDALTALDDLPLERVEAVHLAGGRRWRGRILDDHQHPVPEAVFALLEGLAARVSGPLDIIIERDGSFPAFGELLDELDAARAAVAAGRARRRVVRPAQVAASATLLTAPLALAAGRWEAFLARLYTDSVLRAEFLADPGASARAAGFDERAAASLAAIDREGLVLVSESLAAKRSSRLASTSHAQ
jgi:hypothetical protein